MREVVLVHVSFQDEVSGPFVDILFIIERLRSNIVFIYSEEVVVQKKY